MISANIETEERVLSLLLFYSPVNPQLKIFKVKPQSPTGSGITSSTVTDEYQVLWRKSS